MFKHIAHLFKLMKQYIVCLGVSQILYWLWKLSMFWMSYTSTSSCWSLPCFQIMFLEGSMIYDSWAMFYSDVCYLRINLTDLMYLFQLVFGTLSHSTAFVSFVLSKLEQKMCWVTSYEKIMSDLQTQNNWNGQNQSR